jgi:penicillin-binding protein 2
MAFLGQEEQIREFQDRFKYLYFALFVGFFFLLARLAFLQIVRGDYHKQISEDNRIKRVKIAAPRGMIFDRNNKLLIDNRPDFDLEMTPQYVRESKEAKTTFAKLSKIIGMPAKDIWDVYQKSRSQPSYLPVKIKTDLTRDEVARFEVHRINLPGIEVKEEIKRTNVYGEVAAHLLGYISEVNAHELPILNRSGIRYRLGDSIGRFGLEQRMEDILRGMDGEEIKEVDALGREKQSFHQRRFKGRKFRSAVPGKNLVLTIDQDLQMAAVDAFADKIGSLVAIDPRSGEILAMLSRPSFNPTEFSRGISSKLWNSLLNNEFHPMRDKTIQDHYAPGSVFKVVTAIAGLEEGVIDESTKVHCTGQMRIGNRVYHCHAKHGHGEVDVEKAITRSCDVFFYRVAQKLKSVDDISRWALKLGLGQKTGIQLAGEVPGLMPTEQWKWNRYRQPWNAGETATVAIGQSFVLTTTLQLANMFGAFGNGGTLHRPFIVKRIESAEGEVLQEFKPEVVSGVQLQPKTVELIKKGLWGVMNAIGGTGFRSRIPGATVQVIRLAADKIYQRCDSMRFKDRHNAVFVGFAPSEKPVISVAVLGEHACHGSYGALPIARAVVLKYLEKYFPELLSDGKTVEMVVKPVRVEDEAPTEGFQQPEVKLDSVLPASPVKEGP